jgi:RimJ/RimL family protein N-acetyltransferase
MPFELQPTLKGDLIHLRPLRPDDFDALFLVASDPLIWEQHPERNRYTEERFRAYFKGGIDSGGALIATDAKTGAVIGSSRYCGYDSTGSEIEIGWTFLARSHWGGRYNGEMKQLMLRHAFPFVDNVVFLIGSENFRSQRAVEKIGAVHAGTRLDSRGQDRVVYRISLALGTERLDLLPIQRDHAPLLYHVLSDPALHEFTGGSPPADVDALARQYEYWERRRSPDGAELWFNWALRLRTQEELIGHLQVGIREDRASMAWVVGSRWQGRGYATEAARAVLGWIHHLGVRDVRASIHPEHAASIRIAERLGLRRTDERSGTELIWKGAIGVG